jgi:hypothetical protein
MTFSALKFSRTRMLALMLVVAFSFAAVGATAIASADATTAAKKKSKKCKKGYKKVGKKCKKKKKKTSTSAPAPETVVSGANLVLVRQVAATKVQIKGTINFSKPTSAGVVPAVVNITTATEGNRAANVLVKVSGGETSVVFSEISQVPAFHNGGTASMTVVGTITTNTVPVK